MTPAEYMKQEAAAIEAKTGRYMPPWRVATLLEIANKIWKLMTNGGLCVSYAEFRMVLRIVARAIDEAAGEEEQYDG